MASRSEEEQALVRYLLGEPMSSEEQAAVEDRYIADDRYFEKLLTMEDTLIDDYLHHRLSAAEATRFENVFLASPRRRLRFEAHREVQTFFTDVRESTVSASRAWWRRLRLTPLLPRSPAFAFGLAAAGAAAVIIAGLTVNNLRLRREINDLQVRVARQSTASPVAVAAIQLSPGLLRDASARSRLELSNGTQWVNIALQLEVGAGYAGYEVSLETAEGQEIWKEGRLPVRRTAAGNFIDVQAPGRILQPGDYVLRLSGIGERGMRHLLPSYALSIGRR